MKVRKIDELILETECNRIVKAYDLPRKEWGNVKTILNGMFGYAVRKKYLRENTHGPCCDPRQVPADGQENRKDRDV